MSGRPVWRVWRVWRVWPLAPRRAGWLCRVGLPGWLGIACMLAGLVVHAAWLPALRADVGAAQADLASALREADARRSVTATSTAVPPEQRFKAAFAPAGERHLRLAALVALARVAELATGRIESRWLPGEPLARYELTMPLTGEYAPIRAFIIEALASDAGLSLDGVRLRRAGPDTAVLDAELRWSLHLRADDAGPSP